MKYFLFRRLILLVPLLIGISFITFSLVKSLPGDPVLALVGERSSPEDMAKIGKKIGADRNLMSQYLGYCSLLLQGELGRSYYTSRKVADDIAVKFPNTMRLAVSSMLVAVPAGMVLGVIAALRKGRFADRIITAFCITGAGLPVFWSGLMIMLFFSLQLKLLPPSGTGGIRYLILPALTLSIPALASLIRVTRTTVIDIVKMPYIRTARSKGISERMIILFHIIRNAVIPITTMAGLEFGSYLNGSVLTETIFNWDGMGRFAMEGIVKRDYPVIMGCLLAGTVAFVSINIIVDIIYHYSDPRVRLDGSDR